MLRVEGRMFSMANPPEVADRSPSSPRNKSDSLGFFVAARHQGDSKSGHWCRTEQGRKEAKLSPEDLNWLNDDGFWNREARFPLLQAHRSDPPNF
jgi:hypothetical protein